MGMSPVGRIHRPYDLMWPVARRRMGDTTKGDGAKVSECTPTLKPPRKPYLPFSAPSSMVKASTQAGNSATEIPTDLREYAQRLLSSFPAPGGQSGIGFGRENDEEREDEDEVNGGGGGLSGCREAVEILTRNPKKGRFVLGYCVEPWLIRLLLIASYDVNKDGVKVAELTFVKSAYRLGETVLGVVELNARKSRARVLSVGRICCLYSNFNSHYLRGIGVCYPRDA